MSPYLKCIALIIFIAACSNHRKLPVRQAYYNEPHRPQFHFSPKEAWMNDPNGMVYYNNTYHLFYQFYPDSTVWGPMHWGHATSKDIIRWEQQPIALYPDSLGYIFSGSAVIDSGNTSGFGKDGKVPLVAIFTHHNSAGEKSGSKTFQAQSIAYSLDEGKTWTKYAGNPVLQNPGIKDFRDPKVSWHQASKKWIMTLATLDRITFYSSPDLKAWTKESEFGKEFGAHGGVWECPDLFTLEHEGKEVWVLLISINPGGPNGGSATQYFTGNFDGKTFTPFATDTRWIDYGTDNYAGVTWSNTGARKLFVGWMSNWQYANVVPTKKWRSAMTIPRELGLQKVSDKYLVTSTPVKELEVLNDKAVVAEAIDVTSYDLSSKTGGLKGPAKLKITGDKLDNFTITLSNGKSEKLIVGYDASSNSYFIDRSASGRIDFDQGFARKQSAPRLSLKQGLDITVIIDNASIELFADGGLSVMTAIFFPTEPYTNIIIQSPEKLKVKSLQYHQLKTIWK
ncbi:MAG TPA: glycoside hydrolase family 32 protein [Flavisolibacter sp.]|nr:glycoside hydrolase family 32 protein [Flavisolibacter sp.]